ncbi:MAG TPA: TetR family transcriptional regulator, partial [Streptosporangiaceae bacterium]
MTQQVEGAHAGPGIADQRRGQMLTAALDVISERGFADTRIADIAERIGISPALVIYYFKTKDQLLTEAIRHYEDTWYAEGKRRMDALPTAAKRIEEFVAMNLLPGSDPELERKGNWQLWLDFWVVAARNADVASVRRQSDERWREVIVSLVLAGQQAGEFARIDP